MSIKDQSGFYHAGAKALRMLAAKCGEARLARIFETQAERFLLMAEVCAQSAPAAAPPARLVPAKRPNFSRRGLPETRSSPSHTADSPSNVVDLSSGRGRREP